MYLIRPPNTFSPTKHWQEFLAAMEKLPQDDEDVRDSVQEAKQELQKRAKAKRRWWMTDEDEDADNPDASQKS